MDTQRTFISGAANLISLILDSRVPSWDHLVPALDILYRNRKNSTCRVMEAFRQFEWVSDRSVQSVIKYSIAPQFVVAGMIKVAVNLSRQNDQDRIHISLLGQ